MTDTDTDTECCECGVCGRELLEEHNMGACSCDKCSCLCNKCGTWSDMTEEWYCGADECIAPEDESGDDEDDVSLLFNAFHRLHLAVRLTKAID